MALWAQIKGEIGALSMGGKSRAQSVQSVQSAQSAQSTGRNPVFFKGSKTLGIWPLSPDRKSSGANCLKQKILNIPKIPSSRHLV
jgi:hypothetical protein